MTDEELVRVYRQAWDKAIALTKEQHRGSLASRNIGHAAGILAVATEAARRERADVVAYLREGEALGALADTFDAGLSFADGGHVGAAKGGA